MTVAVLASPEDGDFLHDILMTLSETGVDAYGLKIHGSWESIGRDKVIARVEKASHYLAIATQTSLAASWFSFATGYGYSRGANFALFRFDPGKSFPRYLAGLPVFDVLDELAAYYRAEKTDWLMLEDRRTARSALLEMGISVHNDTLAQCARDGDTKAVELFMRAGFHPTRATSTACPCSASRPEASTAR